MVYYKLRYQSQGNRAGPGGRRVEASGPSLLPPASWASLGAPEQRLANLFCRGPDGKHYQLCGSYRLFCDYSTCHRGMKHNVRTCVWLCAHQTLFISTAVGWSWLTGHSWPTPGPARGPGGQEQHTGEAEGTWTAPVISKAGGGFCAPPESPRSSERGEPLCGTELGLGSAPASADTSIRGREDPAIGRRREKQTWK